MKSVVFLGPSLPWEEAKVILPMADYRPPAGRGDIAAVVGMGFDAIGLIDGVFYQRPAVAPREILLALDQGMKVLGGSSMGALRAAELDAYGMLGVGKIYSWYKEGKINSDDEVALVFHPETFEALSEPLVNIRATLEALLDGRKITQGEAMTIITAAKDTPFQLRNSMKIVQAAMNRGLDKRRGAFILSAFKNCRVDQKKLDAQELLAKLNSLKPEKCLLSGSNSR
jgi:hypothetical protein